MAKASILVVEDRFIVAEDIANNLRKLGYEVCDTVMSGEEAIQRALELHPDLVLMDINLKGKMDGIEAAIQLKQKLGLSVVYLTAHSDDMTLQRASATEPLGYLLKPFEERQLYTTVEMALNRQRNQKHQHSELEAHSQGEKKSAKRAALRGEFLHIIGEHSTLLELLERVELVAKTDVTVHIFGENGTGKELIADALHHISVRKDKPFVKLNCSAIPTTLLESALFGHVKGSFTGATRDQQGFVEHAEGGTLFLDEIGDLSPEIQVKLLRLLQAREYCRVGDAETRKADLRIITATNRNLKDLVKEGKIREDFFYRIHVFPLVVPTLKERQSDIVSLAEHFRTHFNSTFEKNVTGFSESAKKSLEGYSWPGNIRELENAVRHAFVVVPENGTIEPKHLPPDVIQHTQSHRAQVSLNNVTENSDEVERDRILNALAEAQGNKTRAAKLLGYSRVTLWKKMIRFGLEKPGDTEAGGEESENPNEAH